MTKADPVGELLLLSLADTCAGLGYEMKTLRRRIAGGAVAVIRDGRVIRIHPDDLRATSSNGGTGARACSNATKGHVMSGIVKDCPKTPSGKQRAIASQVGTVVHSGHPENPR